MKNLVRKMSVFTAASLIAACGQQGGLGGLSAENSSLGVDSQKEAVVSFKLTDAPNKELKSVIVNIDHMEVVVAGRGKAGRLMLAKDLGPVDLLKLQNGVTLPLQDVVAPAGIQIQQIRLVLKEEGHYAVKGDDSVCDLKTPSAQKTGVKIILTNKVEFEAGHQYSIVVDFDALKSVVIQGNGGCLLKPVLKLKSAYKSPIENPDSGSENPGSGSENGGGEVVTNPDPGSESGGSEEGGGEVVTNPDSGSESGGEVVTNPDPGSESGGSEEGGGEVVTNPDSGSESGGEVVTNPDSGSESGGEELVTNPDQNDSSNDGWDYTPVIDGQYPVITQEELRQM
ncbi:DUF4382 domain-containing protein [Bdellovibrio sp. HCB-110]|uniref:DUF4382 domain-containing protein n=1 Tax=Bdellovibrio sp. HCB-110 TaxID=3391182 RepID=UPI0039B501E3